LSAAFSCAPVSSQHGTFSFVAQGINIVFKATRGAGFRLVNKLIAAFPGDIQWQLPKQPEVGLDPILDFYVSVAEHVIAIGGFESLKGLILAASGRDQIVVVSDLSIKPEQK
jgi:hypothetical protein